MLVNGFRPGRMTRAAYLCGFMAGFDSTSQFFVFPDIRDQLADGDTASASWILTIAGIVGSVTLLQAGRLGDRFGHNRVLIGATATFATGSLLASIAPSLGLLIAARGLQAAGFAALGVSSISVIVRDTPTGRLATVIGSWGFWTALSGIAGPILSAVLIDAASWRWVFAFEVVAAVLLLLVALPGWGRARVARATSSIDYVGTVSVAIGLAMVVLALLEGNDWGWLSIRTIGVLSGGLVVVAIVVMRSQSHADPVIPLDPFRHRAFVAAALTQSIATLGFFAMWLALLSYMTDVWDYSVLRAGLLLTLMPGGMAVLSKRVGKYCDEHGFRNVVVGGGIVTAAGFAATALLVDAEPSLLFMLPAVLSAGVGMATMLPPTSSAATRTLAEHQVGTGTAMLQTLSRLAGGLGPAVVVALLGTGSTGDPATHRLTIWLIVICGAFAAILGSGLRDQAPSPSPQRS